MALRERFDVAVKAAMKGGDAARVSTLRMILAGLKEADLAARPEPAVSEAVEQAVAATGAKGRGDLGKVMAALQAAHEAEIDLARAAALVKARLPS